MPSGSHSSSGGSHFSGGGSSQTRSNNSSYENRSASSWSNSSSSNSNSRYDDYYYGRRNYSTKPFNWKAFWIVVFSICGFVFMLFSIINTINVLDYSTMIKKCDADYEYYQGMCKHANENAEYLTSAEVYDMFYNEYAEKYYVKYKFHGYLGETYSVYTYNEAAEMMHNFYPLAINCKKTEINADTDSILMDYYQMDKYKDGEYSKVKLEKKETILAIALQISGLAVFIFLIVIVAKKRRPFMKLAKEQKSYMNVANEQKPTTTIPTFTSISTPNQVVTPKMPTEWTCNFCLSVNPISKNRCSSCGASKKIDNKDK